MKRGAPALKEAMAYPDLSMTPRSFATSAFAAACAALASLNFLIWYGVVSLLPLGSAARICGIGGAFSCYCSVKLRGNVSCHLRFSRSPRLQDEALNLKRHVVSVATI